jgi:hypothetical protein
LRRTYPELVEAIRDEEMRLGCPMTVGEIDAFARGYHAEEYRLEALSVHRLFSSTLTS